MLSRLRGTDTPAPPGRLVFWAAWLLLVLATAAQGYVSLVFGQKPASIWRELTDALLLWWPWAAASAALLHWILHRRWQREDAGEQGAKWSRHIGEFALHSSTAAGWACLYSTYLALLHMWHAGTLSQASVRSLWLGWLHYMSVGFVLFLLGYAAIGAAGLAYDLLRRQQLRRLETAALQAQLSEAQLQALKLELRLEGLLRQPVDTPPRLSVRVGDRTRLVDAAEVDWVAADGNYSRLHVGPSSYLLREPLKDLHHRLQVHGFRRIHRSTLVNTARVRELRAVGHGDAHLRLQDGTELRVSRRYRSSLSDLDSLG